jgi:hypothetical protein
METTGGRSRTVMLDDRDPEASGLGWDQQHPVDLDVEHGLQRTRSPPLPACRTLSPRRS